MFLVLIYDDVLADSAFVSGVDWVEETSLGCRLRQLTEIRL